MILVCHLLRCLFRSNQVNKESQGAVLVAGREMDPQKLCSCSIPRGLGMRRHPADGLGLCEYVWNSTDFSLESQSCQPCWHSDVSQIS